MKTEDDQMQFKRTNTKSAVRKRLTVYNDYIQKFYSEKLKFNE